MIMQIPCGCYINISGVWPRLEQPLRSIVHENELVTTKVAIIFNRIKFINVIVDLTFEEKIAKLLHKAM